MEEALPDAYLRRVAENLIKERDPLQPFFVTGFAKNDLERIAEELRNLGCTVEDHLDSGGLQVKRCPDELAGKS